MEPFIHITNDTANINGTDLSSVSATPSQLPESPPDSGSEPPYSPADLHVLSLCNTPIKGNHTQISDIHLQQSNGQLSNSSVATSKTAPAAISATSVHVKPTTIDDRQSTSQSATDGIPSITDISLTNEIKNSTTAIQPGPRHILRNTNVLYVRSTDSDRNATQQSHPTTNSRATTNTAKTDELLLNTSNGVTSAQQQILQQVCLRTRVCSHLSNLYFCICSIGSVSFRFTK